MSRWKQETDLERFEKKFNIEESGCWKWAGAGRPALWSSSQPPGQRIEDKVSWAISILNLYKPEELHGCIID